MVVDIRYLGFISVVFALSLFVQQSFSQVSSSKSEKPVWSIGMHAGVARSKIIDETFSQQLFIGYNPAFTICGTYEARKIQQNLNISTVFGNLTLNNSSRASAEQVLLNLDYFLLFKLNGTEKKNFLMKAGPGIQVLYSNRRYSEFINRNNSYENLASVGFAGDFRYKLRSILHGINIVDKIIIPIVFAYSDKSSFDETDEASLLINKPGFRNILKYKESAFIPEVASLKNSIAIEKDLSDYHTIRMIYTWQYYHMKVDNIIKQANHQLALSYNYYF